MKIERVENTKKGIFFGMIYQMTAILLPFIIQMVTIRQLGLEYIGIKGLFTSILSVFSLAELGVGNAIVFLMYKPIADDDINTLCALLSFYRRVYRIIGGVILLLGLIILPFLKYLIKGEYPRGLNIYFVFFNVI